MKKGLSSFIIILIILTLNSCAFLENQSGTEYLDTKTFEVSESLYNSIRKKYNLTDDNNYVIFDNYEDYFSLYSRVNTDDLDLSDQEDLSKYFNKNVKICYVRKAVGERTTYTVAYSFGQGKITRWEYPPKPFYGKPEYNDDDVKYFVDIVDASNRIAKKIK
ncbi:MAG: hypothetical protein J6K18_02610 [Bacilli bacterium]|nr:hypothetical protein [Bacilli bacterium]